MRHASEADLQEIGALLTRLRAIDGLRERKPGVFYRRGAAFLHFHEDHGELYADIKVGSEWERTRLAYSSDHDRLLESAVRLARSA